MKLRNTILVLCLYGLALDAMAAGQLGENQRISSTALGYDLQFRVYLPENYEALGELPVIYVTDGQSYINQGELHLDIDKEIAKEKIEPVIAVFVDSRDPDKLETDRRNSEFLCNEKYAEFFVSELLPRIDAEYNTRQGRANRVILGYSLGALNSACFGLMLPGAFSGIAMQSPALHPVTNLFEVYEERGLQPLELYVSSGYPDDNTLTTREWRRHLEEIGYEVHYREINQGHNWTNWRRTQKEALRIFFAAKD